MTGSPHSPTGRLLDAVISLAEQLSPERVQSISARIRGTTPDGAVAALSGSVSTPAALSKIIELVEAWRAESVNSAELSSMLLAASHGLKRAATEQSIELVWTGPTTPFVSARRTEQALLQVIHTAEQTLFITSFVAYDVSTVVNALNSAAARGVSISMLLESSLDQGGSISFNALGSMSILVPSAKLYAWRDKADPYSEGRVHAKVAVADRKMCFITSANLTGHAMEKNMEAGVLLSGGQVPALLSAHLASLVDTNLVSRV
jgi:cardiolipin synthase